MKKKSLTISIWMVHFTHLQYCSTSMMTSQSSRKGDVHVESRCLSLPLSVPWGKEVWVCGAVYTSVPFWELARGSCAFLTWKGLIPGSLAHGWFAKSISGVLGKNPCKRARVSHEWEEEVGLRQNFLVVRERHAGMKGGKNFFGKGENEMFVGRWDLQRQDLEISLPTIGGW